MSAPADVLVLSLGTTNGLRIADAQLAWLLEQAGVSVAVVGTRIGATNHLRRGYPVNDIVEALAARRALAAGVKGYAPRAAVLSTTTAALLAGPLEIPFAVWLDSPARLNRPGPANAMLHVLERRALARATLVMPHSKPGAAALPAGAARSIVVPPPIAAAPLRGGPRRPLAVAYVPDPPSKGLDLLCAAWEQAALPETRMAVAGIDHARADPYLERHSISLPAGVELVGMLSREEFRKLLGDAHVFVSAARWEDFGQAPLEALDRGALLVCAPAGGPFPALEMARALSPPLVPTDRSPGALARAIKAAFATSEDDRGKYAKAARQRLEPYRPETCVERLRAEVLPALLGA